MALLTVLGLTTCAGLRSLVFFNRRVLDVESVRQNREYDRFISNCGVHANLPHFVFNAAVICLYGIALSNALGGVQMLAIFLGSALGSSVLAYWVNRGRRHEILGASGAACGLVCAYTLAAPGAVLPLLPAVVPGWIYALLFLAGSYFAHNRKKETITYSAHLGGAIGGVLIAMLYAPELISKSPNVNWLPLFLLLSLRVYFAIWPPEGLANRKPETGASALPDLYFRAYRSEISEYSSDLRYQQYDESAGKARERQRMDTLLDKISRHGPDSLKPWERRELERLSLRLRRPTDTTT
ncbi:rhomboid family intramembrane serine protease [Rariglobus hedericola]|uniref:rhomboid family intramembrane serine protease n=1 Tax=Rariglobus hedericola TaxID=2597822 RepID=UPI001396AB71|nr:rhomboid family intramembrane serine protease [Rariglobus hedericola]